MISKFIFQRHISGLFVVGINQIPKLELPLTIENHVLMMEMIAISATHDHFL